MAISAYKPTSAGRRGMDARDFTDLTRAVPEKSLTSGKKSSGGRNDAGRITTRFRGGGVKRRLRKIDFRRDKDGVPATVAHIEYDPNRSARIALLNYADGEKRYIIAPLGLKQGDILMSGDKAEYKVGNSMPLRNIPEGVEIHNIEVQPGRGGALVRSAGQAAVLRAKEARYGQVKLPSGEVRQINLDCRATVGQVSNTEHSGVSLGKAGRKRYLGKRPHVRGVAMNPVDHPMGGGEGRTSGGSHPCSPWGQPAKGFRTRNKKKASNKFIVERRKK